MTRFIRFIRWSNVHYRPLLSSFDSFGSFVGLSHLFPFIHLSIQPAEEEEEEEEDEEKQKEKEALL